MRRTAILACLSALGACAIRPQPADVVLTNGVIWTGIEGQKPQQAIAMRNGRIIDVGSDEAIHKFVMSGTREIDLHGRLVVPGFIDDHTHFMSGGYQLASVDLRDAATPREFTRRIAAFARKTPAGSWIVGGDWDDQLWPGTPLPRKEWIDSVTKQTPVLVNRLDGHMALANSRALELAGVRRATKDPPGGTIVRDAKTGQPTGMLKDEAMDLVARVIPAPEIAQRDDAFRRAQAHALSSGVTMITDMGSWDDLQTYRRAHETNDLKLRIYAYVPLSAWDRLRDYIARKGSGDSRLKWGGVKGFVDGSLGSGTAWFFQPYTDAPQTSGLIVTDTIKLREWITSADRAGLQVAMHAVGDHANNWILDTYAVAMHTGGRRDRRFRVEHAQHLLPGDIPRFAQLGVIPSMQPYHAIDDGRWAEKRIGKGRIKTTYAFRSLLDAGAKLTFGSDWTVAPIDPLLGIYAAVTRRTLDGKNPGGWVPEQKITVEEALRAYTENNAYAAFMERDLGALARGRRADMVVLSRNILQGDPLNIPNARVDYTIIQGQIVYARPTAAAARGN
jgi:predicted amidohydrolase YtcJ